MFNKKKILNEAKNFVTEFELLFPNEYDSFMKNELIDKFDEYLKINKSKVNSGLKIYKKSGLPFNVYRSFVVNGLSLVMAPLLDMENKNISYKLKFKLLNLHIYIRECFAQDPSFDKATYDTMKKFDEMLYPVLEEMIE